jgi:CheY-like chemotaxis protein
VLVRQDDPAPGRLVLVVEDDEDVRETVAGILEDEGYRVGRAANGLEALAYLRDAAPLPGVILLDLMMPVMNGWEFRAAQQAERRLAAVPVVVLSGDAQVVQKAERLGAVAVLGKPVSILHLLEVVGRCCTAAAASHGR